MKKNLITNWAKYFAGVCAVSGMLLVTACGDTKQSDRETEGAEYGMGADPDASGAGIQGTEVDRTSNTYAAQRNYDVNTMGTAAKNRRQMEAAGKDLNDQDYQRLRQEYDDVNTQLRESYRQSPGLSMRYTDDHQTADHSYDYYGVYYDNVNDEQARNNFSQMEQRRQDLKNQMRGKIDKKTGAYLAAEMDAVPKEGYDQLYQHLSSQTSQAQNTKNTQAAQASNMQGTVFVEFVVDKNGKVNNPKVVDVLQGEASTGNMSGTSSSGTTTGAADRTGTGTNTGTGTSGEGTTDNATNTGMSPNSTGTVGSGNTAGTEGTTTGTTGNSTASGDDGAQTGQSGQAASSQTTQSQQNQTGTSGKQSAAATGTQSGSNADTKQLEQQALTAIKSTSGMWEPAQMNGQPVASIVQMPIPIGMDAMNNSGNMDQMNNGNMNQQNSNDPNNTNGTNMDQRTNDGGTNNNNTGIEGGTNNNPGSGTQNGGRTSTGTVNTGEGTGSGTTDTDGGR